MLLQYISIPAFIISFAVGLFFVYIVGPEMKTIYIYPSPETVGNVMVRDKAENCFYYEEREVECPTDESLISTIPIQAQ